MKVLGLLLRWLVAESAWLRRDRARLLAAIEEHREWTCENGDSFTLADIELWHVLEKVKVGR